MGNKDKDQPEDAESMGERTESTATQKEARNAHHNSRDVSWERDTALQKQISEAVARETEPVHLVIFTCKDTIASGSVD